MSNLQEITLAIDEINKKLSKLEARKIKERNQCESKLTELNRIKEIYQLLNITHFSLKSDQENNVIKNDD